MVNIRFARITSIALLVTLAAALAGCELIVNIFLDSDGNTDGASTDGTDLTVLYEPIPVDIGLVAPLTGQYAHYGLSMQRGFNLARDEINAYYHSPFEINFITEDNGSTAEGSVAAYERLIDAGVPAIVGVAVSTHAKHAFPVAQENRVVAFSPISSAAGLSSIGDYIFRAALAVDRLNPAGVRATHSLLGYERVALIYDDADVYSAGSNEYIAATLEELGVEVTTVQTFQTGDTDFAAQLTEIMKPDPDAVFISALATEIVRIITQGREIGITSQYITPLLGEDEVRMAGHAAEGTVTFRNWSSTLDNPINRRFVDSYLSTYGVEPDHRAARSYATLYILFTAMVETLRTETTAPDSTAIRDALAMTRDLDTLMGHFSFDPNGEALYEPEVPVVLIVENGNFVLFDDSSMAVNE